MKHVALVMAGGFVLLVGCSREPQKPESKAPPAKPAPITATQPKSTTGMPPVSVTKTAAPSTAPVVASIIASAPNAPTNRLPASLSSFLRYPPPERLDPESEAGRTLTRAQELFRQGETNAATDLLKTAVKGPGSETASRELVRSLVALLLGSGRVDEGQAICMEYAVSSDPTLFCGPSVTHYLIEEKGDAAAAVAWTEQLAALPLQGFAADMNLADHLTALSAAGRRDEVIQRVPDIVVQTNDVRNARILGIVAERMIRASDFDGADLVLGAIEKDAGSKAAYSGMVTGLRGLMDRERKRTAGQATDGM